MKDFNDLAESALGPIKTKEYERSASFKKAKDAFIVGADYLFDVSKAVKIGPRVAFLQSKAEQHVEQHITLDSGIINSTSDTLFTSSLVPIMFGVSCNKDISEKFSLNWKLFLGYGLVFAGDRTTIGGKNIKKLDVDKSGGCFVSDISMDAQYWLTKRFGLGLGLGYRLTSKAELGDGLNKTKLDFSGLTTKLSLSYKI
ncbi:MAG: hypothetical protein LE168_01070 [Endomicrobium sp.]|nr:hypothetical protein [Endomicrobium sp.]